MEKALYRFMKALQRQSQKLSVLDPKIEEALRLVVKRAGDLSQGDVKTIQALIWDLPPDPTAVCELLYDLAWDLEFTLDGWSQGRERAMEEIAATLEMIEELIWLEQEIGPVYDAMRADPGRGIPAREVFASIRARHADRMKKV